MAKVVSDLFTEVDGVVEIDPAWQFPYFDEHMGAAVSEDYADVDVLLLGRATYDSFAGAWPDREAEGGEDATFATNWETPEGRRDARGPGSRLAQRRGRER